MLFKDFMEMFHHSTNFRIKCFEQGQFDKVIDQEAIFIYKENGYPEYMEFRRQGWVEYLDTLVLEGVVEWAGVFEDSLCVCITYGELPC